jgi:T-complex protein 1 subunit epsilon
MIKNRNIVPGGGATELAASLHIQEEADKIEGIEQYSVRGFAEALEDIPLALATNSGYNSIQYLSDLKEQQTTTGNPNFGVDAMNTGNNDMIAEGIYESVMSKKQQLQLSTQVVKMILKIDDVISPAEYE